MPLNLYPLGDFPDLRFETQFSVGISSPDSITLTYDILKWTIPTLKKFPRDQRFLLGDRIENHTLDVLELLYIREGLAWTYMAEGKRTNTRQRKIARELNKKGHADPSIGAQGAKPIFLPQNDSRAQKKVQGVLSVPDPGGRNQIY